MRDLIQSENLLAVKTAGDVRLAPDGSRVAYVVTETDVEKDENRSTIWVAPTSGGDAVQFTRGPKRDTAPRWSPDGAWLAFLSERENEAENGKHAQLYVMPANGGEPRKLTSLERGAGPAAWSPDGKYIVFESRVPDRPKPKNKDKRKQWEQRPRVITRAEYKADGQGYILDARTHLFLVPSDGSRDPQQITFGNDEDRHPTWSPDGTHLAFTRNRPGPTDYSLSDVWTLALIRQREDDIQPGELLRCTSEAGRAMTPVWSPDGTSIACFGTDEALPGAGDPMIRVWLVPAAGGAAKPIAPDYDRSAVQLPPPALFWSPDGRSLTFVASASGSAHVVRASVEDGQVQTVVGGARQVTSLDLAAGQIAFSATQLLDPGDVYAASQQGAAERRLTQLNQDVWDKLTLPQVERRTFDSPNGGTVEGWLYRPPAETGQTGPTPLLLQIHGGPHSFFGNAYLPSAFYAYVLACRGWSVLTLNPTGSGSYGREFAHAIRGRWGEHDLPEQMAAVDSLIAEGVADPTKLAVAGYSYGGYMTSWTVTHTDRFKAAVVGAPVTNLESFFGTSDIGLWFGAWEMKGDLLTNRETFRRLSPINYVDRVTTPTLIIHGEADDRCPIEQAEQFFIGLLAAGRAPAELIRYPGGAHGFVGTGRPSHRLDYCRRVVEWVERFTLGAT